MPDPHRLIRYLRDCYRADNREGGVLDLFAAKNRHLELFDDEAELLEVPGTRLPVLRARFEETAQAARLDRRERNLLYATLPIAGRPAAPGNWPKTLCAPLLTYPASLEEDPVDREFLWLEVEAGEQRLNAAAVAALVGDGEGASEMVTGLLERMPLPPFGEAAWQEIRDLLEEVLPQVELADAFRKRLDAAAVRTARERARRQPRGSFRLLRASALVLAPASPETRGILDELERTAAAERLSRPLSLVLGSEGPAEPPRGRPSGAVPAVLSHAQSRILASAASAPLTQVVGPPGTGKSYTLAAVALDAVSRGESVLLASRGEQALDVLAAKIRELLGEEIFILRGGRRDAMSELKGFLDELLHGGTPLDREPEPARRGLSPQAAARRIARLEKRLGRRTALEILWGEAHTGSPPARGLGSLGSRIERAWASLRLAGKPPPWDELERYEELLEARGEAHSRRLRRAVRERIARSLARDRPQLVRFRDAVKARRSSRQERLFETLDLPALLHTFPLWMVTFADAYRVLPLEPELFDLVVIDEATQCDMATCLPVLQRARRAVVTGDPKQLRHVSFLSRARQRALAERQGLSSQAVESFDFRAKSLLDRANEAIAHPDQVVALDEHFRSAPQIIRFSNREIYGGRLKVMTRRPATRERRSVEVVRVEGRRGEDGRNRAEAAALVAALGRWVEEERGLPAEACHSLGVLSPFRDQVEHLREEIARRLSLAALDRHRLLLGTPHAFQGEERDVMFLSLAVSAAAPVGSFVFLDRPDVFNVSITRARGYQAVFCSVDPRSLRAGSLLRRYLEDVERGPEAEPEAPEHPDPFLAEVREALSENGCRTWHSYRVAGLHVDLVAERSGKTLGIDLIGHPGEMAAALDLERCRMLQRAGLPVFPLPLSDWRRDREACVAAMLIRISRETPWRASVSDRSG